MTIKDILKLDTPIRVKINENFKLEDSIDPGFIVIINSITTGIDFCEDCYKVDIVLSEKDFKHNVLNSDCTWYDLEMKPCLNYFQANLEKRQHGGDYKDSIYVMEDEDCFDLIEENPNIVELILKDLHELREKLFHCDLTATGVKESIEVVEKYKNKK